MGSATVIVPSDEPFLPALTQMLQYDILKYYSADDLIEIVNDMIAEGWQPIGGIAIAVLGSGEEQEIVIYSQAMIRKP